MTSYIALIHKEPGSDYGVSFPDLPGCVTAGHDLDEARDEAQAALELHLAGLLQDGEPIPAPSDLERVMEDLQNRDGVAILVSVSKPREVTVSLPADEWSRIDAFAATSGLTRAGFLARAARRVLSEPDLLKKIPE